MTRLQEMKMIAEGSERNRLDAQSKLNAALAREAALREELYQAKEARDAEMLNGVRTQQRLTVAEQQVQRMVDCSKGQDSVATGYLSDILALLKPAAEGEVS